MWRPSSRQHSPAPAHILHDGFQHGVQLDLTPRGAALLLGGPPGEIAGTSLDLGELVGPSARRLHERLAGTADRSRRFDLVLAALFTRREARWEPRPEVEHAWRVLRTSRGRASIREVGWSPRHLGECFRPPEPRLDRLRRDLTDPLAA